VDGPYPWLAFAALVLAALGAGAVFVIRAAQTRECPRCLYRAHRFGRGYWRCEACGNTFKAG
jgi:transposase